MKATEQYFHVVLFITLYKVVLTDIPKVKSISSIFMAKFVLVAKIMSKSYLAMIELTYVSVRFKYSLTNCQKANLRFTVSMLPFVALSV